MMPLLMLGMAVVFGSEIQLNKYALISGDSNAIKHNKMRELENVIHHIRGEVLQINAMSLRISISTGTSKSKELDDLRSRKEELTAKLYVASNMRAAYSSHFGSPNNRVAW